MAAGSVSSSFLLLLFHHLISSCSSGNVEASSETLEVRVLSGDGRVLSSTVGSDVSSDLLLNESQLKNNLISSETYAFSCVKARLLHNKSIRNVIVRLGDGSLHPNELQNFQLTLETVNRIIRSSGNRNKVGVLVAIPMSYLEKLIRGNAGEMIISSMEISASEMIIEANVGEDQESTDRYIRSKVARPLLMISRLPVKHFCVVLAIRGLEAPKKASLIRDMIIDTFETKRTKLSDKIVEVRIIKEPMSIPSHRGLLDTDSPEERSHDQVFPITPAPTFVTVPGTAGSVAVSPTNPTVTPSVFPPIVPITFPTPPVTTPPVTVPPVTVPMTPTPVTNPVTTYPPTPGMPAVTPIPLTYPPGTSSASPAIPGQSWCVANSGASEAALQAALDYACGIGGVDCSQIQMGASCYNPNSLQNHASYAFNSYYQRNPVATSCDFGGTATIVTTNPSTGSCVYPASSQTSTPATTTTPIPTPTTESFPPPSAGAVPVPGSIIPPPVLIPGTPSSVCPTGFGFGFGVPPPPGVPGMYSSSIRLQPSVLGYFVIPISLALQHLCIRHRDKFLGTL